MRTTIILLALWFGFSDVVLAQNDTFDIFGGLPTANATATNGVPNCVSVPEAVPTRRILPEDIVQDSIQLFRFSTNSFAVRWTYTEAGAKKAIAFWEAHPSLHANYTAQWKEGWLKRRTDKCFFKTEETAKAFMAELTRK
jgi:hypothetical protein